MFTLKDFRRVTQRDFENGAVREEIEKVIESRDELLAALKGFANAFSDGQCGTDEAVRFGLATQLFAARAAIRKAEGGE